MEYTHLLDGLTTMLHRVCILKITKFERPTHEPDVEGVCQKILVTIFKLSMCEIRTKGLDELILDALLT